MFEEHFLKIEQEFKKWVLKNYTQIPESYITENESMCVEIDDKIYGPVPINHIPREYLETMKLKIQLDKMKRNYQIN